MSERMHFDPADSKAAGFGKVLSLHTHDVNRKTWDDILQPTTYHLQPVTYHLVMLSLIIPVFNEENSIEKTVATLHTALETYDGDFEIVVVNDGSTDRTQETLSKLNLQKLRIETHPINRGYGASIKTGIRRSTGEWIATVDADGTYPLEDFPKLIETLKKQKADMVVGARTKKGVKIPLVRRPAKAIINWLANILCGMKIPDVNSGMSIFTRDLAKHFMHLYPQRFSFTMTITLAALTNDYLVHFEPIDYYKRTGKSTMSAGFNGIRHFLQFLGLIVRITTYFRPLRFFAWPGILFGLGGMATITWTLVTDNNISDAGLLLLLTGIQIGLFGILADGVVRNRNAA